ncbi:chloroplast stem-loop binding protein of 41 kDa b, chloroplastic-like [Brassica rapa]|uniref:chloroplast stem-loop binding protein of 41 kDa b, chloroplastic-like n=1 Tax=Brassica campestris TaxID=3711 RepID=UPI0004F15160|nr:chloroplast stem-loop binding protein of 41 kDa b, chloroplastic-like [Brassica rapa]
MVLSPSQSWSPNPSSKLRDPDLTTRSRKDLATALLAVLGNEKASREIINISGEKYVTFDGLARACAKAGGFPEPEIVHYNPKEFDFGKTKAFPFRDQHFFASV